MIPELIPTVVQIIETFINAIMDMLPQILEMGIVLLTELINRYSTNDTRINTKSN